MIYDFAIFLHSQPHFISLSIYLHMDVQKTSHQIVNTSVILFQKDMKNCSIIVNCFIRTIWFREWQAGKNSLFDSGEKQNKTGVYQFSIEATKLEEQTKYITSPQWPKIDFFLRVKRGMIIILKHWDVHASDCYTEDYSRKGEKRKIIYKLHVDFKLLNRNSLLHSYNLVLHITNVIHRCI